MRSKAPLALMEQLIMILVFALAAVLCLRIFVWCDSSSKENQLRDEAVILVETAAETLQHFAGDLNQTAAALGGNAAGDALTLSDGALTLSAVPEDSGHTLLGQARIAVTGPADQLLFELTVCWQKEVPHE